jgi:23S rRNA-intervening sequence protein
VILFPTSFNGPSRALPVALPVALAGVRSKIRNAMAVRRAKELDVYKDEYELAKRIFKTSKSFPAEECYALTSQIRRSSHSVAMNLREAWAKRRFEAHFVSKLTDCDG